VPRNRFPDTKEKRELRRRDARKLRELVKLLGRKLEYCGLPGVEFLDVEGWKDCLESVIAFEYDFDTYNDMLIERDRRDYPFPITINPRNISNILDFLHNEKYCFDLYNLDFFGGLVYPRKKESFRTTEAFRRIFQSRLDVSVLSF
jgi:hypothetical protein